MTDLAVVWLSGGVSAWGSSTFGIYAITVQSPIYYPPGSPNHSRVLSIPLIAPIKLPLDLLAGLRQSGVLALFVRSLCLAKDRCKSDRIGYSQPAGFTEPQPGIAQSTTFASYCQELLPSHQAFLDYLIES